MKLVINYYQVKAEVKTRQINANIYCCYCTNGRGQISATTVLHATGCTALHQIVLSKY